jgi:hypothetical protein
MQRKSRQDSKLGFSIPEIIGTCSRLGLNMARKYRRGRGGSKLGLSMARKYGARSKLGLSMTRKYGAGSKLGLDMPRKY